MHGTTDNASMGVFALTERPIEYLESETRRLLDGCRIQADDETDLYTPDSGGHYAAIWTRDFAYMVEYAGDLIPSGHIDACIRYLVSGQGADGWIPDRVETGWTASYEKDWSLVFHAPFADYVGYGGQDQYREHTLRPGESTSFEGWLQVIADGDLSPALEFEAKRQGLNTGIVEGSVQAADGSEIADPIIVVQKDGITYGWSTGKNGAYKFTLPEGKYSLHAIAANHSASSAYDVEAVQGEITRQNFYDLQRPGEIHFQISDEQSGEPLDARIRILEGETSTVEYLGRSMIFTDTDEAGSVSMQIAPGSYLFEIGSGAGFLSRPVTQFGSCLLPWTSGKLSFLSVCRVQYWDKP